MGKEKIFLITGITGHLGRNVASLLLEKGEKVRGFVLKGDNKLFLDRFPRPENLKIYYGDIRNEEEVEALFEGTKEKEVYLIHCAALITLVKKKDQRVYDVNVNGTKNITDAAIRHKVHKYVYVSSTDTIPKKGKQIIEDIKVYDEKKIKGCYGKTKTIASAYVLNACKGKINASLALPSGILGPNDFYGARMNRMIYQYRIGKLHSAMSGGYDMVDVRDVAKGVIAILKKGKKNESYILSNSHYDIVTLLDMVSEITGQKKIRHVIPRWVVILSTPFLSIQAKLHHQKPQVTAHSMKMIGKNTYLSHAKAERELGYHPREMKETIKDIVEWVEENPPE